MKKRPITTITISTGQAVQLRKIADVHGLTLSDLIARFIASEIKRGTIVDEVPGFRVGRVRDSLEIEIGDSSVDFVLATAHKVAEGMEHVASHPAPSIVRGKVRNRYYDHWYHCSKNENVLFVRRRGRGVLVSICSGKIASKIKEVKLSISPDAALHLARIIRSNARA